MEIDQGLFDHMVLQRNASDVSEATVTGTCSRDGRVLAYVERDGQPVAGFENDPVGNAADGRFEATLNGLPAGGPYEIQLSISSASGKWLESVAVTEVLVGDVWLLGGQSNMQGVGLLAELDLPHPEVRAFYMDDHWDVARDPLHALCNAIDPVHPALAGGKPAPNTVTGVGPGVSFGKTMQELRGVPQGLIACAHGGTSMTQWDPSRRDEGGNSLYGAMIRRFRKNGGRVAGLVWYQGESDANADAAPLYTERMVQLAASLRQDTGCSDLPIAIVQISRVIGWAPDVAVHLNSIQDQERLLPQQIDRLATVPAIDLSMDDNIHISARGQRILGRRLAEAMQTLTHPDTSLPPPIELGGTKITREDSRGFSIIELTFDHVVGSLQAAGRPWGFTIGRDGKDQIFDVRLLENRALIYSGTPPFSLEGDKIYYGFGTNPYCNITDQAGRSLPVLGPVTIGHPRAVSPAVQRFLVSPILPGNVDDLAKPPSIDPWQPRDFPTDFAGRHDELLQVKEDAWVGYACSFACPEPMAISLMLGYDGPVRAWLDGKQLHDDPAGTNPATPVDAVIDLGTIEGSHQLVVALGARQGSAWGIFVRFLRTDLPEETIEAGGYAMPKPL